MLKFPLKFKGFVYGKLIKELNAMNIKLNITAVYSFNSN